MCDLLNVYALGGKTGKGKAKSKEEILASMGERGEGRG